MSTIMYTLEKCVKCLKCIKVCPTGAMTMHDSRIHVDAEKCVNCGACTEICNHLGLQIKGSQLKELNQYDYCVALVPTAIYGDCESLEKISALLGAIKKLGFDEVVDLSRYDGFLYDMNVDFLESENKDVCLISSFCPVVNKLIENKYPMLLSNRVPFEYAAEIAAKKIRREKSESKGNVGIFLLCECIAKLDFAKYPYENESSEIDHAISLADIFPLIIKYLNYGNEMIDINRSGLKFVSTPLFMTNEINRNCIAADGLSKVENILELLEFGQIKNVKYFHLSNCINGCIGGNLLWGNSFDKDLNLEKLMMNTTAEAISLPVKEAYSQRKPKVNIDQRSLQERLEEFAALNKQVEVLPGYDCGACGYPSCRAMAEDIIKGNSKIESCHVLR